MNLQEALTEVEIGTATAFKVADAIGGGKTLTLEARRLLPEEPRPPKRAESPPCAHTFYSADSLGAYLAKYGSEKTVVFADHSGDTIFAVIDETAKTGFEIVAMKPGIHPLWKPWSDIAGKTLPLKAFALFVAQNRRTIAKPDGRDLALLLSQVRASVTVQMEEGRGKNAVNGVMVTSKIQGKDKTELVEIPDEIALIVPLYVGTEAKDVELDLCVDATPDGVSVLVTAGTVAEAKVAAFEEMVGKVRAAAPKALVTLGKPGHGAWAYLAEMPAPPPERPSLSLPR